MRKRTVILSLAAVLVCVAALAPFVNGILAAAAKQRRLKAIDSVATLLVEARKANTAHDIAFERKLLENAVGLEGTAEELAEVQRRLAVLDWKHHASDDAARARLRAATGGAEPAEAWLALARMEQAAGEFDAARAAGRKALASATTDGQNRGARMAISSAAVEKSVTKRLARQPAVDDALREAFGHLQALLLEESGRLDGSRRLLQAALLLDRGDAALAAWRSYYHVAPGGPMPNAVADAGRRLETLLPTWAAEDAQPAVRVELARALADSRFFLEAALVASDPRNAGALADDPSVREIVAYAGFLRRVGDLTEEYYRLTSLGRGSKENYLGGFRREAHRFLTDAALADEIDEDAPIEVLRDLLKGRFGAIMDLGKTAGFFDLHMGHIVVDESRTVEQYGHAAEVRFVVLDSMVSNGFQSWAWESGAQHGGWGGSELIVQIRPPYIADSLDAWRVLANDEERREFTEKMTRESAADEARATADPHAYLPGLVLRLQHQGRTQLLERLRERGLEGEALHLTFLGEYERVVQESSIFAHEGRHAIDARGASGKLRAWEKEYNAKLSEVAFAPEPRLALEAIFSPNIGSDTPHGRANAKIMKGLVSWMEAHRAEIEGFDSQRPSLPQFDLLTDEQIRQAFRSLDPLAG